MKYLLFIPLLLLSGVATAQPMGDCEMWQQKANSFMTWRQQGLPIADAVKETAGNISRGLLLQAYAEPKEEGLQAQYDAIEAFSRKIYQQCLDEEAQSEP
jgi:hypothetical protein